MKHTSPAQTLTQINPSAQYPIRETICDAICVALIFAFVVMGQFIAYGLGGGL
jgi:hypothetical protein